MSKNNPQNDRTLERLVKETAEELGINVEMIWRVYNHFYSYIYRLVTLDKLGDLNLEKKKELAKNIVIPGFGRLLNAFGKTYKPKGVKENKIRNNYD